LVAEQLAIEIRSKNHISWDTLLTPEIGNYLKDILDKPEDYDSLLESICNYRGVLDMWVIDLLINLAETPVKLFKMPEYSPWPAVAFFRYVMTIPRLKTADIYQLREIFAKKVFRFDITTMETENHMHLIQFLYLRARKHLIKNSVDVDQEFFTYMKQKFKVVTGDTIRLNGATVSSGLNRNFCFIESWDKFLNRNEFMYSKARIVERLY
jgi:hypothetical protein